MELEPPLVLDPLPPLDSAPRRRNWLPLAILALVAFAAGIGAVFALQRYRPAATPQATPTPVASPTPVTGVDALSLREAELSARLAALEQRTQAVGTDAAAASGNAGRAEALLITFAARRMLDRGQPLGYLEPQLRARFGSLQPQAVEAVAQAARAPVTLEDLRAGLDGVAPLLTTGAANNGWLASLRHEFGSLVVVHRTDALSPLPADRMARARRLLDSGQVDGALGEVGHLPGAASANAWMDAAKRFVTARRALDLLEATAIGGGTTPPPNQPLP